MKDQETAVLTRERVESIMDTMKDLLSKKFGVTIVHDANGAYGQTGKWYVTLRFGDPRKETETEQDHITVSMTVEQITSYFEDRALKAHNDHWEGK